MAYGWLVTSTATVDPQNLERRYSFCITGNSPRLHTTAMADQLLKANGQARPGNVRHPTAPSMMMNAHFASVGDNAASEAYEHGIQVIDEDKIFKYVLSR